MLYGIDYCNQVICVKKKGFERYVCVYGMVFGVRYGMSLLSYCLSHNPHQIENSADIFLGITKQTKLNQTSEKLSSSRRDKKRIKKSLDCREIPYNAFPARSPPTCKASCRERSECVGAPVCSSPFHSLQKTGCRRVVSFY